MADSNALVIVVDRWSAGSVGCYGNTWSMTPALNRLAAESFVFDSALVDSPDLDELYRGFWHAALRPAHARIDAPHQAPLVRAARAAGRTATLLTDSSWCASAAWAQDFDELVRLSEPPALDSRATPAATSDETHLAVVAAETAAWLATAREPFFAWVHLQGFAGPWDAPQALREQFVEDDEPRPPNIVSPPDLWLPEGFDPDERLGVAQAYAAQVAVWDECLEGLLAMLAELPCAERTWLWVQGARGFPTGEHGRLGPVDHALFAELVQPPYLLRSPQRQSAAARSSALVLPCDLSPTLSAALGLEFAPRVDLGGRNLLPLLYDEVDAVRDRAVLHSGDERALRTPAWHLRCPRDDGPVELYVKPDDRLEVNDVARRCPEIVDRLGAALAASEAHWAGEGPPPAALEGDLLEGLG